MLICSSFQDVISPGWGDTPAGRIRRIIPIVFWLISREKQEIEICSLSGNSSKYFCSFWRNNTFASLILRKKTNERQGYYVPASTV